MRKFAIAVLFLSAVFGWAQVPVKHQAIINDYIWHLTVAVSLSSEYRSLLEQEQVWIQIDPTDSRAIAHHYAVVATGPKYQQSVRDVISFMDVHKAVISQYRSTRSETDTADAETELMLNSHRINQLVEIIKALGGNPFN